MIRSFAIITALLVRPLPGSDAEYFKHEVLPVLDETCVDCHEAGNSKGDVPFMYAETAEAVAKMRSVWRSVAAQLRNRTMPPPEKKSQPTEEQRMAIANWIDDYLRRTACNEGPYAGNVVAHRLNRREYDLTVQDLCGVDLKFSEKLPLDSGAGEGFDNNGETLFMPPMLMERYLEAAQQIVDAAIVSPALDVRIAAKDMHSEGKNRTALVSIYTEDDYEITLTTEKETTAEAVLKVDGLRVTKLKFKDAKETTFKVRLTRGDHAIGCGLPIESIHVRQQPKKPDESQIAAHRMLLGVKPGETPKAGREHARKRLAIFLPKAFRRPVKDAEIDKILSLYDRGAKRGDPFAECMKLAIKGVLVAPDFLYRIETDPESSKIQPITNHELATRLSYFLWSRMPDDDLRKLADEGQLQNDEVLAKQVDRMLDDPRSIVFARSFSGQWLGTKDVGGRVAPIENSNQNYYTVEVAADLREQAVVFFHRLVKEDRSILDLVDSDYTYLTGRLGKFYQIPNTERLKRDQFDKVMLPDRNRGGVLGMGAVLAMTSHKKRTSPVLRGAWVFDTLIGMPVPSPPPDIPPLDKSKKKGEKLSGRDLLKKHRDHASCRACHNIIDPIGFALENFDPLGRWRVEADGLPIDATGELPSGESFDGPGELKQTLLKSHQPQFVRHLTRKLLGYALGRGLVDRDDCTIEELATALKTNDHKARTLIKGIVLSTPFRNRQQTAPKIEK